MTHPDGQGQTKSLEQRVTGALQGAGRVLRVAVSAGQTVEQGQLLIELDNSDARGEFAALNGPSGSGKSTLLNIIGLLDRPGSGKIFLIGQEAGNLAD